MSGFHKMIQIRQVSIICQHNLDGSIDYLLDGVGKKRGAPLEKLGWEWLRGNPGCWITRESFLAQQFIDRGIPITHYRPDANKSCKLCNGTGYFVDGYAIGFPCSCTKAVQ